MVLSTTFSSSPERTFGVSSEADGLLLLLLRGRVRDERDTFDGGLSCSRYVMRGSVSMILRKSASTTALGGTERLIGCGFFVSSDGV